ncbi:MAG: hypothetical protein H7296_11055 [Bacteroidia bacterium]|nr:hypothetical protein [Bacteroidia bacterium]
MKVKIILFISFTITLFGCKNDLVINAPYKDIAIIYSFLDQNEPVQFIRIEKLYQNNATTNTTEGAQIADSLYFDTLVVKLINIVSRDTFYCYRVDSIPKDKGFFSSAKNTLYATKIPQNNNADEVYQLHITNPKDNKTFISKTSLVKDAAIDNRKIVINLVTPNHTFAFRFTPGRNAALYDLIVRFQYKEMIKSDTNNFEIKNVDYFVAKSAAISGSLEKSTIVSREYMNYLRGKIVEDNTKVRRSLAIIYQAYGGSAEFASLLDLSKPNLSVVQKNPEYSNVSNAIGIFSSRNFVELKMETDPTNLLLIESNLPNFHP